MVTMVVLVLLKFANASVLGQLLKERYYKKCVVLNMYTFLIWLAKTLTNRISSKPSSKAHNYILMPIFATPTLVIKKYHECAAKTTTNTLKTYTPDIRNVSEHAISLELPSMQYSLLIPCINNPHMQQGSLSLFQY